MKTTIPAIEKAIAGEIKTVEELGMNLTLLKLNTIFRILQDLNKAKLKRIF